MCINEALCEGGFSTYDDIITPKRNRLSDKSANDEMVIGLNAKTFNEFVDDKVEHTAVLVSSNAIGASRPVARVPSRGVAVPEVMHSAQEQRRGQGRERRRLHVWWRDASGARVVAPLFDDDDDESDEEISALISAL